MSEIVKPDISYLKLFVDKEHYSALPCYAYANWFAEQEEVDVRYDISDSFTETEWKVIASWYEDMAVKYYGILTKEKNIG